MRIKGNGGLKKNKRLKKFELLFNEISDALFLHDFDGNILNVNNYACEKLGFTKEEFTSMNVNDFAPQDILQNWDARIKIIRKEGQHSFETKCITKDDQLLDVEIISRIIVIDKKELVLSSGRDITKRKNYETQLLKLQKITEENEFELNTIFNKAPSTMILFDKDSKVLRINKKGILKFSIGTKNVINQRIGNIINCAKIKESSIICGFSELCLKCQLADIINNTIVKEKEYNKKEITIEIIEHDKPVKKTMLVSTSFLKKNGKNTYLATIDDITSRKQMELDLIAAKEKAEESEKLKTAFLNNISHEIRTPLNGILGFIDFFDDDSYNFSKEDKKRFIQTMHKSSDRLINTVTDLVEVSKLDSGIQSLYEEKIELFNELQKFVNEQQSLFINPNVIFEYEINSALKNLQIVIDKTKLFQVLKNLVNNASKFTSQGEVFLSAKIESNKLIFLIADTGIGIDPKYKECIYEPFRQGDHVKDSVPEGTGLGLTISKKLAAKLGGDIWFDSEPGKGTNFYFSVPFKSVEIEEPALKTTTENNAEKLKLNGKRILVAEDEISNFLYIDAVLTQQGCQLTHATNGKEAIEMFEKDPSFDLIIMDLKMPVIDGLEATRKIKAIKKQVPIVGYSAHVLNGEKQEAMEAGCNDYLSKPIDKEKILAVIEKQIGFSVVGSPENTN